MAAGVIMKRFANVPKAIWVNIVKQHYGIILKPIYIYTDMIESECQINFSYPQCMNGGICTAPAVCSCPKGYQGRHCEGGKYRHEIELD